MKLIVIMVNIFVLSLVYCGRGPTGTLSDDIVKKHPKVNWNIPKPKKIDASQKTKPKWIDNSNETLDATNKNNKIPFVGRGYSDTKEKAKESALNDLRISISDYISVEIEAEQERKSESTETNNDSSQSVSYKSKTYSNSDKIISDIKINAEYWELIAYPNKSNSQTYHYFIYAEISQKDLDLARLQKKIQKEFQKNKKILVVTPFINESKLAYLNYLEYSISELVTEAYLEQQNIFTISAIQLTKILDYKNSSKNRDTLIKEIYQNVAPDAVISGSFTIDNTNAINIKLTVDKFIYTDKNFSTEELLSKTITNESGDLFKLEDDLINLVKSIDI